ncbi:MAG: hypothetical protein EXR21_01350 [Flavobacteriaceae bacterium]|nr:hypothetical protein [Flavobacteriaceae bacterium]
MKKVLSVMIAAAMVSFVACKGKAAEENPAKDTTTMAPPAEPTIDTAAENAAKMMVADSTKPAEGAKEGEKKDK